MNGTHEPGRLGAYLAAAAAPARSEELAGLPSALAAFRAAGHDMVRARLRPTLQRPTLQRPTPQRPIPQRPTLQRSTPQRPAPQRPAPRRPAPRARRPSEPGAPPIAPTTYLDRLRQTGAKLLTLPAAALLAATATGGVALVTAASTATRSDPLAPPSAVATGPATPDTRSSSPTDRPTTRPSSRPNASASPSASRIMQLCTSWSDEAGAPGATRQSPPPELVQAAHGPDRVGEFCAHLLNGAGGTAPPGTPPPGAPPGGPGGGHPPGGDPGGAPGDGGPPPDRPSAMPPRP